MKKTLWKSSAAALSIACLVASSGAASAAETLVKWDLTGNVGNEATESASFLEAGITSGVISRGVGLGASTTANSFNSNNFDDTVTTSSTTTDEYVSFSINFGAGSYDLVSLSLAHLATATGPGTIGLFYSGDAFATSIQSGAVPVTAANVVYDLSGLANVTGSVEFRLIEIGNTQADLVGATAQTGAFRILNHSVVGAIALTAVPEPHEYGIAFAGMLLALIVIRRRKATMT